MNTEKMVAKLIKAQEAINEPIIITIKTAVKDEVYNSFSGDGSALLTLQMLAMGEIFEAVSADIGLSHSIALKKALLKTLEMSIDETIERKYN